MLGLILICSDYLSAALSNVNKVRIESWVFICLFVSFLSSIIYVLSHCMDLPNSNRVLCIVEILVKDGDSDEKTCLCIYNRRNSTQCQLQVCFRDTYSLAG